MRSALQLVEPMRVKAPKPETTHLVSVPAVPPMSAKPEIAEQLRLFTLPPDLPPSGREEFEAECRRSRRRTRDRRARLVRRARGVEAPLVASCIAHEAIAALMVAELLPPHFCDGLARAIFCIIAERRFAGRAHSLDDVLGELRARGLHPLDGGAGLRALVEEEGARDDLKANSRLALLHQARQARERCG